jgi:anti-sigma factor RsiW
MNCRGVLDALSDYLEGEAGATICRKIEEHLRGCERCRMHIDTMKKIVTLCKKWRDDPIPPDVMLRLRSVVARECVLSGMAPPANLTSRRTSTAAPGVRPVAEPAARGRRKRAPRGRAESSKRKPRKR